MFKNGARYNSIGPWLKEYFGCRIAKTAIDGGFTCPNRDGTLSYGGCTFCSERGSGDFAGNRALTISEQMSEQVKSISNKWSDARYIAYFQNYTNTYAPVSELRRKYFEALDFPECCGIAIATRPDCIDDDVLSLLSELNEKTFLWVELGLQTSNDHSAVIINRRCSTAAYDDTVDRLLSRGIRVVTHVIFGLPGETNSDMLATVRHICRKNIFGIKIHLLHIMTGTALGEEYLRQNNTSEENYPDPAHTESFDPDCTHQTDCGVYPDIVPMSKEDYINIVADALELIPPEITIHRLTGDAPKDALIAPIWSRDKKSVLNSINMELKKRGTVQGYRA